jgi:hypothetical protein
VVSNSYSSEVAANILILIGLYVKDNRLGRVTGTGGGYRLDTTDDQAFINQFLP